MLRYKYFVITCFFASLVCGQTDLQYNNDNFSVLQPRKIYNNEVGSSFNIPSNYNHPDFGQLPYDAPVGKNVVEQLHKRTETERFYVDLDDKTFFYIQKSINPINYYKNGFWQAVDPTLEQTSPGIYEANRQPYPFTMNLTSGKRTMMNANQSINFSGLKLLLIDYSNQFTYYQADFSNYSVGNNGAIVTDVFPGVDMKIRSVVSGHKTDFIIKNPLISIKKLVIFDSITMSSNLNLSQQSGFPGQLFADGINVNNQNEETQFVISKAVSFDASTVHINSVFNNYRINNNVLEIHLDSVFLVNPTVVYPITIDPLFIAVGPIAAPSQVIGSRLDPNFCNQVLTVTYPGGSTPWDFSSFWEVSAGNCCSAAGGCRRSWALVDISSDCGGKTPTGLNFYWSCPTSNTACLTTGIWNPTIPFNSSGTQSMVQCLPPSCLNQNITFTYTIRRPSGSACTEASGCDCTYNTNTCIRLNDWNVTLQGRTMETLGNTTTGNGSTTINVTCFGTAVLNPNVLYGVPPYTYLWSPGGETTSTITYTANMVGTTTYTVTVTDACGDVKTAIFTVTNNCVLPVTLKKFDAQYTGSSVDIIWETATEQNADYFLIERSLDGIHYTSIAKEKAKGGAKPALYSAVDTEPVKNTVMYYRLKQFDVNSNRPNFTHQITVFIPDNIFNFDISPNPTKDELNLNLSGLLHNESIQIEFVDALGNVVRNMELPGTIHKQLSKPIEVSGMKSGVYFIRVTQAGNLVQKKLIIQ